MKFAFSFIAHAAVLFLCHSTAAAESRPNILFILADDMGWTALHCYGNKDALTPNLDRLAAQGMKFTSAYADAQCSPTRAAFLSGQYGARTGVFKVLNEKEPTRSVLRSPVANDALPPSVGTLASTLRKAGYATGISGKWHVAGNFAVAAMRKRAGFFDSYGFDFAGPAEEAKHREDKCVSAITDDIIEFITVNQAKPWFAFAAHLSPHAPMEAPDALIEKQVARGFKRTERTDCVSTERPTANYLAMLEHLDAETGRLLAKLDELKLTENTVVIFTSDNGGLLRMASNAPLREGKGSPYEGGIRVPAIVRWPGKVKPGSKCDVPTHFVDYYPTFAELAGVATPPGHVIDGESLLPLWRQAGSLQRTTLHWHMPTYTTNFGRTPCAIVREGDWKLIHWFGDYLDTAGFAPESRPYGKLVIGRRTELYNLRDDLSESHDLAAERPKKTAHLTKVLNAWLNRTGAKLPSQNPDFEENRWWTSSDRAAEIER